MDLNLMGIPILHHQVGIPSKAQGNVKVASVETWLIFPAMISTEMLLCKHWVDLNKNNTLVSTGPLKSSPVE